MEYRGERIDVRACLERLPAKAEAAGFTVAQYGEIDGYPLYVLTRDAATTGAPHIYLSAGVHGDEPAGPIAVEDLMARLPLKVSWTILPLVNPVGMAASTRENGNGIDVNRDYATGHTTEAQLHLAWLQDRRFDLAICMHEDWEAEGFYVYELNPYGEESLARIILDAAKKNGPVETAPTIDGFPAVNGLISREGIPERPDLPEAILLARDHARQCYTLETPSNALPLSQRATMQTEIILAVAGKF